MQNFLVTGGAGFIGSNLVRALLQQGDFVRVLDNFSTGKRENLSAAQTFGPQRFELLEGDLRDPQALAQALRGVETVFHEAAFVSVPQSMEDPLTCFEINQRGTELLLEAARQAGVRRVVLASSAAVYGDLEEMPLTEEAPLRPLSPYAVSKRVNELYAQMYTRSFGLDVVALRYFNVYGPRQRPDSMYAAAVPIFACRLMEGNPITIYGDGGQTRDLVFVGDVVRANLAASQHPAAPGQVFNVCTGQETRILDLVDTLRSFFPQAPAPCFDSPRAGDIYRSLGSPQKAHQTLGFRAQTSLREGLSQVVEYFQQAPSQA